MYVISEASTALQVMLKKLVKNSDEVHWSQYCVHAPVEEGILIFNLLTRELILLTKEEYDHFADVDYLRDRWFVVPNDIREKENADFLKWVLTTRQPKAKEITEYTIFTTTDCNARCFYCFELGRSRIPMSIETAQKVVQYIKKHCGEKPVKISWFGGEPLFNVAAIDTVCEGLRKEKISFSSTMISNGYLFDDEIVRKSVEQWKLKSVQITLDGTENIYNKTKAFIYKDTNPYEIVMDNIGRLLDAEIRVSIRLNMDLYNADDLQDLVKELAQQFAGKKGLSVYAHHLFKMGTSDAELHTEEEWEKRKMVMEHLVECIVENNLYTTRGISKNIKLNHCMADSGKSVTILPDGNVGLCENFSETEFVSHIEGEGFDAKAVASWKERTPEIPECAECFYFLDCVKLKKCPNESVCYRQFREEKLRSTQRAMLSTYEKWKANDISEEPEEDNFEE